MGTISAGMPLQIASSALRSSSYSTSSYLTASQR
jgi:hypothetical protein